MSTQPSDYVHTVGRENYTPAQFLAEAKAQGISRRIGKLPDDLVPGSSRIYLCFDASRDSAPRKCVRCGAKPLPKPIRDASGTPVATCALCGEAHTGKAFTKGKLTHYFVPNAIEVVVQVSDAAARELATAYQALGILNALDVTDTPETLSLRVQLFESTVGETLRVLQEHGATLDATVLAGIVAHGGALAVVAREPKRGCGYRATGGQYVRTDADSPVIELEVPITYTKPHFRGLRKLTDLEGRAARTHVLAGDAADPLALPFEPEPKAPKAAPDAQSRAANDDTLAPHLH